MEHSHSIIIACPWVQLWGAPGGNRGIALVQLSVVVSKVQGINYGLVCERGVVMAGM